MLQENPTIHSKKNAQKRQLSNSGKVAQKRTRKRKNDYFKFKRWAGKRYSSYHFAHKIKYT